jgi:hypothetical protein
MGASVFVSGASKMTLYKWWPSKGALALDGYFAAVEQTLSFPDTGDIEADLRPQVRGQLRVDVDPQIVVDQLWGACYHRLLIPDEPITDAFVDGLIANVVRGIRP